MGMIENKSTQQPVSELCQLRLSTADQSTKLPHTLFFLEVYYSFACNLYGCAKVTNIFHHQITLQGSGIAKHFSS